MNKRKKVRAKKPRAKKRPSKLVGCDGMVGVPRAEIENLRRDAARLDWLQANYRRELVLSDNGDVVELTVWQRRYLTSYDYEGPSVRNVLDQAMTQHPNPELTGPKGPV